jgi:hypothetical protein
MYAHQRVKTAWYCGLDRLPKNKKSILQFLDFLKLGHYDQELGGLNSPSTNQRFYQYFPTIDQSINDLGKGWKDVTYKLQSSKV